MGKASVIEESRPTVETEAPEVTCQHHWVIDSPRGAMSQGRCKRCGEEREFRNSATDHLWEDDSGGGYNAWRGSRPARGAAEDDEVAASTGSSDRKALIA